ncbi:hypothetical protein TNCV_3262271 [Trichonephila clavipes]|nr:hypothetical protein TNCV_3262271 [Trichonephila clavipes]
MRTKRNGVDARSADTVRTRIKPRYYRTNFSYWNKLVKLMLSPHSGTNEDELHFCSSVGVGMISNSASSGGSKLTISDTVKGAGT